MKTINKEMTISDILSIDEKLQEVLMGFGMHCFSCPCALAETLEEAAEVHEIEIDFLIEKLNEALEEK